MVRYIRLDDELDTIAITGLTSGRQYQASRDEANWKITRTPIGWFGGGTVDCEHEVR